MLRTPPEEGLAGCWSAECRRSRGQTLVPPEGTASGWSDGRPGCVRRRDPAGGGGTPETSDFRRELQSFPFAACRSRRPDYGL